MSAENVRLVERVVSLHPSEDMVAGLADEASRKQFVTSLAEFVEPAAECAMVGDELSSWKVVGTGPQGYVENWFGWVSAFEYYRFDVQEVIDAGDRVLTLTSQRARTRTGGIEMEQPGAAVYSSAGGKITRIELHLDQDTARKAAGLQSSRQ